MHARTGNLLYRYASVWPAHWLRLTSFGNIHIDFWRLQFGTPQVTAARDSAIVQETKQLWQANNTDIDIFGRSTAAAQRHGGSTQPGQDDGSRDDTATEFAETAATRTQAPVAAVRPTTQRWQQTDNRTAADALRQHVASHRHGGSSEAAEATAAPTAPFRRQQCGGGRGAGRADRTTAARRRRRHPPHCSDE